MGFSGMLSIGKESSAAHGQAMDDAAARGAARAAAHDRRKAETKAGPSLGRHVSAHPDPAASPIAASRRAVALLDMLAPEAVPSPQDIRSALPSEVLAACVAALSGPGFRFRGAGAALLSQLPATSRRRSDRVAFMLHTGEPADAETHDAFFRIHRVGHESPAAFLHGLFRIVSILRCDLEETPTGIDGSRLAIVAGAIRSTLAAALGARSAGATFSWRRAIAPVYADHPARRWLRGHQIFAGLSQCIIFALNALERADGAGDDAALAQAADLIAELFAASAVSLELTGDFPEQAYRDIIRVSMENPFLPKGFSGLLSNDHRHMVARMKGLRPTIDRLRERCPEIHALIMANLAAVYASHGHVCERFVGAQQASLLMSQRVGRSAVEQIDRFKTMRLRSWAPVPPEAGT